MKNYKLLLSILACGALMLFNLAASAEDGTRAGVVTVISIRGSGEYSIDGGHMWNPLVVGKALSAGSLVRSGDLSTVDLLIGKSLTDKNVESMQISTTKVPARNILPQVERNMVRLRPNSTLGIDKLIVPGNDPAVVSDCQLDLKKGKIFASIKKVSPSSEYFIKIPNGVAAVRGTQIELSTDGTPSGTSCGVASGTVWLSFVITGANGQPVLGLDGQPLAPVQITLNAGQSFAFTSALNTLLIDQAHSASSSATKADVAALLVAAASSSITPITQADLTTLITVLVSLINPSVQTIAITVTETPGPLTGGGH